MHRNAFLRGYGLRGRATSSTTPPARFSLPHAFRPRIRAADVKRNALLYRLLGMGLSLTVLLAATQADLPEADGTFSLTSAAPAMVALDELTLIEEPPVVPEPEPPPPESERPAPTPQARPPAEPPAPIEVAPAMAPIALAPIHVPVTTHETPPPTRFRDTSEIYNGAQSMPVLLGGIAGLQRQVRYPAAALYAGVQGRVIVQFVVDEMGRVTEPVVLKRLGMGTEDEALRVIRDARFIPAVQNGQPVKVKIAIPVRFEIHYASGGY